MSPSRVGQHIAAKEGRSCTVSGGVDFENERGRRINERHESVQASDEQMFGQ